MTNPFHRYLLLLLFLVATASAQPRIDQVQNNYSYLLPGDPNYGIAQGSIFIIKGASLANTTTGLQNVPLQTTLDGVTAKVTVKGTSTNVIWYYVTPGQLGGILPSSTPVGTGTITVTNNGQTSAPAPIVVVQSAFGTLTLDGSGSGAAAVYDAAYTFLSSTHSARPGDIILLFGSGVGPVTGDETLQQAQVNLSTLPIDVKIGGAPATVLYRGRTIFPGLDQINVQVPGGIAFGCNVSVTVTMGGYASNLSTIPVAANGGTCPAPPPSDSPTAITQAEIDKWLAAGAFRIGSVGLTRQSSYSITDNVGGTPSITLIRSDVMSAGFNRVTGSDLPKLSNSQIQGATAGSCMVVNGVPANPFPNLVYTSLDAGAFVGVTGPAGSKAAPRSMNSVGNIVYNNKLGPGDPHNYLDLGPYTFTGPGGPDVGPFSGTINIAPELIWTNRESLQEVDRSVPLKLTWSGGEPTTLVTIEGESFVTQGSNVTITSFQCWAKNTDGQFTVPTSVLTQLPPSGKIVAGPLTLTQRGNLAIGSVGTGTRMTATGIDYLTGGNQWGVAQTVVYK